MTPEIERVTPIERPSRRFLMKRPSSDSRPTLPSSSNSVGAPTSWMPARPNVGVHRFALSNDLYAARDMLQLEGVDDIEEWTNSLFLPAGRCSLLRKRIGISVNSGKETR